MDANEQAQHDLEWFVTAAQTALAEGHYDRAASLARLAANANRQLRPVLEEYFKVADETWSHRGHTHPGHVGPHDHGDQQPVPLYEQTGRQINVDLMAEAGVTALPVTPASAGGTAADTNVISLREGRKCVALLRNRGGVAPCGRPVAWQAVGHEWLHVYDPAFDDQEAHDVVPAPTL